MCIEKIHVAFHSCFVVVVAAAVVVGGGVGTRADVVFVAAGAVSGVLAVDVAGLGWNRESAVDNQHGNKRTDGVLWGAVHLVEKLELCRMREMMQKNVSLFVHMRRVTRG
eukprot:gene5954-biopygen5780